MLKIAWEQSFYASSTHYRTKRACSEVVSGGASLKMAAVATDRNTAPLPV